MKTKPILAVLALALCALICPPVHADNFGTSGNDFTIDFVNIGNAGNVNDAAGPAYTADGGNYASPYGGVGYAYRMGAYEISQDAITKATASGLTNVTAGAWTGSKPAANMTWYECAAFVNWLNESTNHQKAYDLTRTGSAWTMNLWSSGQAWQLDGENLYRHKDAYYFLPSEDEWYKAAFHKNDGVTANYWDYATGSNTIPDGIDFAGDTAFDAVFYDGGSSLQPNGVTNVGVGSAYGTFGQDGNVWDWVESAYDGVNNSPSESRAIRGSDWANGELALRASIRGPSGPFDSVVNAGFRIASVPEPSSALLLLSTALLAGFRRSRRTSPSPTLPSLD